MAKSRTASANKKMSEDKFIHSILALGGIIVVLVLTVMSYQSLIQDRVSSSTEAINILPGTQCDVPCVRGQLGRSQTRTQRGFRYTRTCVREEKTSRYIWKCYGQ